MACCAMPPVMDESTKLGASGNDSDGRATSSSSTWALIRGALHSKVSAAQPNAMYVQEPVCRVRFILRRTLILAATSSPD